MASLAHVHDSTGCSHDDVNALSEGLGLLLEVGAAVDGEDGQARVALKEVEFFSDLIGQLTRGCEDEGLQGAGGLASLKDGQAEGGCFS